MPTLASAISKGHISSIVFLHLSLCSSKLSNYFVFVHSLLESIVKQICHFPMLEFVVGKVFKLFCFHALESLVWQVYVFFYFLLLKSVVEQIHKFFHFRIMSKNYSRIQVKLPSI